jgi:Tfp pilus assembly protein PilN
MSEVNLLPPDIRRRQQTRRTTLLVALLGVLVLAVIGFIYFLQVLNLSNAEDDLEAQQRVNADLQAQVAALNKFGEMQVELQERRQLVDLVFANEVAWSGVLLDVSRVIPNQAFISTLTGTLSVPTGSAPTAPAAPGQTTGLVGRIDFAGQAFEVRTVAEWLTRLEQVEGWVNPWVTTATEQEAGNNRYDFSSGVDLSLAALTDRGSGQA